MPRCLLTTLKATALCSLALCVVASTMARLVCCDTYEPTTLCLRPAYLSHSLLPCLAPFAATLGVACLTLRVVSSGSTRGFAGTALAHPQHLCSHRRLGLVVCLAPL